MKTKYEQRRRRSLKSRSKQCDLPRLCVHRTPNHIYVQLIVKSDIGDVVLASASTLQATVKKDLSGDKTNQAKSVGKFIAEAAKSKGITKIAFDRSGFKYHGRIKALADSARENGLEF